MTVFALPSLRQPESISPEFYFTSEPFIAHARSDIDHLLNHYHHQLINKPTNGPFLTFKSIYLNLGWSYIHLAVVDPALRKQWFNSIVRIFLDYLKSDTDPLKQTAVLFALWSFWGTQPELLGPKFYIIVDVEMYQYIQRLPELLGSSLDKVFGTTIDQLDRPAPPQTVAQNPHVDPSLFSNPTLPLLPHHSLHQILGNLLKGHAFEIHPSETALVYPKLPTNKLILDHLPQASSSTLKSKPHLAEQIIATSDELARWASDFPNATDLRTLRSGYISTKSLLLTPDDSVRKEALTEAIAMTRRVIQKTGPGLDHLLFNNDREKSEEGGLEAAVLVDGGEGVEEWDEAVKALKANLS
ncbi:hypothetical protein CROQUDRAFT_37498 [Cronartium quercuum f. sp. fusiforme G11]|uniref:Uncharacterized protein n=1 Tax=Cronartium quercuum f. sp. fusiforme G11 TaxID=708437 RepID=A0A9P6NV72_9BASI|nr:hypothetical protein CROQUDRAFT_37498 [Cronartium quercuum f. sp. fusiforme G11]